MSQIHRVGQADGDHGTRGAPAILANGEESMASGGSGDAPRCGIILLRDPDHRPPRVPLERRRRRARRRLSLAPRGRPPHPAPVALDDGRADVAPRPRPDLQGDRRAEDQRRGHRPRLLQRHARPGARDRPAGAGRPDRLHGLGVGDLGQRRAAAAGARLPVPVARLGPRAPHRRRAARAARRRLPRADGADAAAGLGRLVRLPQRRHALARHHRSVAARRPEDPHHPVGDLREGDRADGRQPDADGVRRGLHVAADRRHRRLRARRQHDAAAALLRGRRLPDPHAPHRRRARPVVVDDDDGAAAGGHPRGAGGVGDRGVGGAAGARADRRRRGDRRRCASAA